MIVDGTDNFPTRYLVNDASVFLGKPVVHGSIFRFDGQVTTFIPEKAAKKLGVPASPCYRCLYPEPPPPHLAPSCQEAGVLGILCGIIGTLQATEAIKILLGKGTTLAGRLLTYDSLKMKFRELKLRRDPNCPVCGPKPTITSYIDYEGFCAHRLRASREPAAWRRPRRARTARRSDRVAIARLLVMPVVLLGRRGLGGARRARPARRIHRRDLHCCGQRRQLRVLGAGGFLRRLGARPSRSSSWLPPGRASALEASPGSGHAVTYFGASPALLMSIHET